MEWVHVVRIELIIELIIIEDVNDSVNLPRILSSNSVTILAYACMIHRPTSNNYIDANPCSITYTCSHILPNNGQCHHGSYVAQYQHRTSTSSYVGHLVHHGSWHGTDIGPALLLTQDTWFSMECVTSRWHSAGMKQHFFIRRPLNLVVYNLHRCLCSCVLQINCSVNNVTMDRMWHSISIGPALLRT